MNTSTDQNRTALHLKLLIPLDGSPMAESTVSVAEVLARRCVVTAFLLHVIEKNAPATVHGAHHISSIGEAESYLAAIAQRLRAKGMAVELHVHTVEVGNVAKSIQEHAEECNPDLILLCTHGRGGAREVLFGSIAQQVLKYGKRPVLLVPSEERVEVFDKLETVLVPIDPVHQHEQALNWAVNLARAFGAEICLLLVIPTADTLSGESAVPQRYMPTAVSEVLELQEKEAADYVKGVTDSLNNSGVRAKWAVVRGAAVSQIVTCTKSAGADLTILASHGRAGLGALVEGSMAARIIGQTTKPLLLIKIS